MQTRVCFLALILAWVLFVTLPDMGNARIMPADEAGHASSGSLVYDLYGDLGDFVRRPMEWLWERHMQYPSDSLRRHLPGFALVEGAVFRVTGISMFGARLTILVFALAFASALYFVGLQSTKSDALALTISMLVLATPTVARVMRQVLLDVPGLTFGAWALFSYLRWMETGRTAPLTWTAVLAAASLYFYQLPAFLYVGVAVHFLIARPGRDLPKRPLVVAGVLFTLLLIPWTVHVLVLQSDNVTQTLGKSQQKWAHSYVETDKLSVDYWLAYARILWRVFPVQLIGGVIWLLLRLWRNARSHAWLFFSCAVTAYVLLSVCPAKSGRYALYISLPAAFLTVFAARDIMLGILSARPAAANAFASGLVLGCAAAWGVTADWSHSWLYRVEDPVGDILRARPAARILYCGQLDVAFVFYVRKLDSPMTSKVYRATAQITDIEDLSDALNQERIDVIVYEANDLASLTPAHRSFRDALIQTLKERPDFQLVQTYHLPFGKPGRERDVLLPVLFRRQSKTDNVAESRSQEMRTGFELTANLLTEE